MANVEHDVRDFYDEFGWVAKDGELGEARFREFSAPYYRYHDAVNRRTLACFDGLTGTIMFAGGGDLPDPHMAIASQFRRVSCLDISRRALSIAERKLGKKAAYLLGSIVDIPIAKNYCEAVFCAHVLYHVDKDHQERAIRELIRVTKPGGRIVIVYQNPDSLASRVVSVKQRIPGVWKLQRKSPGEGARPPRPSLYFALHPLEWWQRFDPLCRIRMLPWDVMSSDQERELLWWDPLASGIYRLSGWFEQKFPARAARLTQYPLIVLDKR